MSRCQKVPLIVVCGSSVEGGSSMFWALDTSDSRLYLKRENTRVDQLFDTLWDFIGKDPTTDTITIKTTVMSKRATQIVDYIRKRMAKYAAAVAELDS